MESLDGECTQLKKAYEKCFNSWYSEDFVTGNDRSTPCEALFAEYRSCLDVALRARKIDVLLREDDKNHPSDKLH